MISALQKVRCIFITTQGTSLNFAANSNKVKSLALQSNLSYVWMLRTWLLHCSKCLMQAKKVIMQNCYGSPPKFKPVHNAKNVMKIMPFICIVSTNILAAKTTPLYIPLCYQKTKVMRRRCFFEGNFGAEIAFFHVCLSFRRTWLGRFRRITHGCFCFVWHPYLSWNVALLCHLAFFLQSRHCHMTCSLQMQLRQSIYLQKMIEGDSILCK